MTDRDKSIRDRAYEIWEAEGRPEGREAQHWEQAKAEHEQIEAEGEAGSVSFHEKPKNPTRKASTKPKAGSEKGVVAKGGSRGEAKHSAKTEDLSLIDRAVAVLGAKPKRKSKPTQS